MNEFVLLPDRGRDDDLVVAPPAGPSREELARRFEPPPQLDPPPPAPRKWPQYSVSDLMILMVGVAGGLAGGSWMPTDVFAGVLGLATLLGLLVVSWHPPESHLGKLIWATLVIAYVIAVLAALFRL